MFKCRSRPFVILKFTLHTDCSALYSSLNRISKGLHATRDLYLKMKAAIKTSASPTFRPLAARRPRLNIQCAQKIDLEGNVIAVAPSRSRPRGIVHYLGGAFVGAAPYRIDLSSSKAFKKEAWTSLAQRSCWKVTVYGVTTTVYPLSAMRSIREE